MSRFKKLKAVALVTLITFVCSLFSPYAALADDLGYWANGGWILGGGIILPPGPTPGEPPQPPPVPDPLPPPKEKEPQISCPEKPTQGDPVEVASGEQVYGCIDLHIPGRGMDLTIYHIYQSGFHGATGFGYGWSINYYERVSTTSDGNAEIVRGAGRKDKYTALGGGAYAAPAGIFENLVQNGDGTWTLTQAHGEKHNFNINGALSSIVDRNGNTISFTYDAGGPTYAYAAPLHGVSALAPLPAVRDYRLTQITDTLGRNITFSYSGTTGRLQSITDFNSRVVSFTYDTYGNLLTITKPATTQFTSGVTKTFTYDSSHNLLTVRDAKSQVFLTNRYDAAGRVEEQDLGTGTMTFEYEQTGSAMAALLATSYVPVTNGSTTYTDREGNVTTYTLNANGNATSIERFTSGLRAGEPASYITTYTYNDDMRATSVTYPKGNGIKYTYDSSNPDRRARGNLLQIRRKADMAVGDNNTNDIVESMTYEPNFNLIKTYTDGRGNVTTFTYDYELSGGDARYGTKGNLVTVTFPTAGAQTPAINFTYNSYGQITQVSDPKTNITQYGYTSGMLTSIARDPSTINAVAQITYDSNGFIDHVTDPLSNMTDYDFDNLGWLNQVSDARTYVTKFTYDANGNVTKTERQANAGATVWQTVDYTYDIMNNLETVTDPLSRVTTYTYNDNDDLVAVEDGEHNTTTYTYDERRLLFTVTDANSPAGVTRYDYDDNGNLAKITDAEGNETAYDSDDFDRLDTETFEDTRTNVYTYDKNSNVLTRTNPATQQIQYTYDNLNRLTNQNYPSNSAMNITYAYDVGSLLTSAANSYSTNAYTYDALNRVLTNTQTLNSTGYTVTYAYNDLNQTGVTYPSTKAVTYAYNANNDVSTVSVGGTALMNLTYDTLSRRAQKDLTGTNTKQEIYTYNLANELTTLENKISGGATISKHDYTYDDVSNRLTHAITAAANKSYTYTYNNIYELTGVSGSESSSFAYDNVSNRTTVNGITYVPNNLNQYSTVNSVTQTYDNNGNLTGDGTNTYGYDVESRLTSFSKSGTTASYTYDAFNRRVSKTVNSTTIYYVYDGDDIIEERSSAGALNADWVHGDGVDEPLTMTRGGTTYFYTRDALGSVRELTNSAGAVQETYTYNSYGQLSVAPTIVNPFTFTGREYDAESGNYYYRARHYSPTIGRFLQRDSYTWGPDDKRIILKNIPLPTRNNIKRVSYYDPVRFLNPLTNIDDISTYLESPSFGTNRKELIQLIGKMVPLLQYPFSYALNNPTNLVDSSGNEVVPWIVIFSGTMLIVLILQEIARERHVNEHYHPPHNEEPEEPYEAPEAPKNRPYCRIPPRVLR